LEGVFLTAAFFAGAFLATAFFFAGAFLAAAFFAGAFFTAVFLATAFFFAGAFLAAAFFAVTFLTAAVFFLAIPAPFRQKGTKIHYIQEADIIRPETTPSRTFRRHHPRADYKVN
ncbi:MAG: hypothetical protein OEL75_00895, partial [Kiritimatiellaceae bacterium]|nr:hypothetical protein [Kiritimatiellaceae bacterium]